MNGSKQHLETYRHEAAELLSEIEETILEIEEDPDNKEAVNRLFRAMHTIKGSGAMFGFDEIADFTHHVETVLDRVREGFVPVSKNLIDLILASRDHISAMLEISSEGMEGTVQNPQKIIQGLKALLLCDKDKKESSKDVSPKFNEDETNGSNTTFRIMFRPDPDIFSTGTDPLLLIDELRELGDCDVKAQIDEIPMLSQMNPEQCFIYWDIVLITNQGINAVKDVFIFVQDNSNIKIEPIFDNTALKGDESAPKLGEILVEKGDVTIDKVIEAIGHQKPIGKLLVDSGATTSDRIQTALAEQKVIQSQIKRQKAVNISVPSIKLDTLINLVGEIVITQDRLTQVASNIRDKDLTDSVEGIGGLVGELRDCVLNIRMLPIGTTFSRFKRLVRDLSAELGKQIELITEGSETELDKTVIDRLSDPLVHLIRNGIDHGIETPDMRKAAGKSIKGKIYLKAAHSGANVVITIEDDGAGLDVDIIKSKAIEKGLIEQGTDLKEQEIFDFLFEPGFSTARDVTRVSGRGVGMDVVKREIDSLRGSIRITSKKGKGTTITIFLPLTMAIIDGLLVKVEEDRFVLPLSLVEECVELSEAQLNDTNGSHLISLRDELLPYIRLRDVFSTSGNKPLLEHLAIVRIGELRVGMVVDEIIGEHQTVIKSLGKVYQDARSISGATILGNGIVALIIDIPKLIQSIEKEVVRNYEL